MATITIRRFLKMQEEDYFRRVEEAKRKILERLGLLKKKKRAKVSRDWRFDDFLRLIGKFMYEGIEAGLLEIIKNSKDRGIRPSEILTVLPIPRDKFDLALAYLEGRGLIYKDKNGYYHYKGRSK